MENTFKDSTTISRWNVISYHTPFPKIDTDPRGLNEITVTCFGQNTPRRKHPSSLLTMSKQLCSEWPVWEPAPLNDHEPLLTPSPFALSQSDRTFLMKIRDFPPASQAVWRDNQMGDGIILLSPPLWHSKGRRIRTAPFPWPRQPKRSYLACIMSESVGWCSLQIPTCMCTSPEKASLS